MSKAQKGLIAFPRKKLGVLGFPKQGKTGPSGAKLPWIDVDSDTVMQVGYGYRATANSLINLSLPTSWAVGDPIEIIAYGLGGFKILVPNGKQILISGAGNETASDGSGYIESRYQGAFVMLRGLVANTEFLSIMHGCAAN